MCRISDMASSYISIAISAIAFASSSIAFAYETPAELKFPYVSTYYVQPTVSPDEDTVINFYATDWNHSLVRFGDGSKRFNAFLRYSTDRVNWTERSLMNLPSGDHSFNLGHLPVGDYYLGIRVEEVGSGLSSHTVWHEFRSRTAESQIIPASETYTMTEQDLADYGITPEVGRYKMNIVNLTDAEMDAAKSDANEYGYAVDRATNVVVAASGTYEIFTPAYTNKLIYKGFRYMKVVYAPDYDFAAVENEATNNIRGIQRLLDDCARNGYRKLVMLPGKYRLSGYLSLEMPQNFTLDLNGATLKENGFTGASGCMINFTHTHDSALVNGTLEGDYYEHDYAGSPNNSEWPLGVSLHGDCRYCVVENVAVSNITGYGVSNGTRGYDHTFAGSLGLTFSGSNNFTRAALNLADGTLDTSAVNQFTSDYRDLAKFTNNYVMVSKYLGYQGISTKSWYYKAAFYDADKNFLHGEVAFQYRHVLIPPGAKYMRISVEAESFQEIQDCALRGQLFKLPWNCTYRNLNIFRCRCVGMAPSAMRNMLIENNEFSFSGDSAATCAFDAEDGWDQMQDVTIRGNYFHDNNNAELLTCAGHNFVIENNRGKIHLYSRTNSPCVRSNVCNTATFCCDSSRNRTMHGRYIGNKYRDSLTFGNSNTDIGWFIATSDPIKSYVPGKEFGYSPFVTGRLVDTTIDHATMQGGIGIFDNLVFTNCHFVMTSSLWNFNNCEISDTYIQHCNKTNSLTGCTVRNCNVSIMNGGTLAVTNTVFENFYADSSYWSKPNTLLFDHVTVHNTNLFWKSAAYSVGNFDVRSSTFETGSDPAFRIQDLRAQDTDVLTGKVSVANSFFSDGGAFTVGANTSTKRIEFDSFCNRIDGDYVTANQFISPLPPQWTLKLTPGEGEEYVPPIEYVDGDNGCLKGGPLNSESLDLVNFPDEELCHLYSSPFVATNRVTNAGNWQNAVTPIWTKKRTWVFWGQMWFDGGVYRFGSSWSDTLAVKIDGEIVYQPGNNTVSCSGQLRPTRGWHNIEFRFYNANDNTAGPRTASANWTTTHGFGINTTSPEVPSNYGHRFVFPVDNGSGNLFRYQEEGLYDRVEFTDPQHAAPVDEDLLSSVTPAAANCPNNAYIGATGGDWHTAGNWSLGRVPAATDNAFIKASVNVAFSAPIEVASLVVSNAACLSCNFASGKIATRERDAGNTSTATDYSITAHGDVTLLGTGKIYMGGNNQKGRCLFAVKGDLNLAGTASELAVYAGPTNNVRSSFRTGGARVAVGGTTTLAAGCWIYPVACRSTGNSVIFDLQNLVIADGAGFNAKGLGFYRSKSAPCSQDTNSWTGDGQWAGAHRGKGSGDVPAYDFELAPFYPGSGGNAGNGGGTIRINAKNITLNGTLDARPNSSTTAGGGGGVWVTCETFTPGVNAKILAQGLDSGRGGGGGGGIAIGIGLKPWQIAELYDRGGTDKIRIGAINEILNGYLSYNISAGTGTSTGSGGAGSAVAYVGLDRQDSSSLQVVVDAPFDCNVQATPSLGLHTYTKGTAVSPLSIVSPVVVTADGKKRMSVTGYTVNYGDGSVQSGTGTSINRLVISGAMTLTWHLADTEYITTSSVLGDASGSVTIGGSAGTGWTRDGASATLSATPSSADYEFQYWIGDVPYERRYDNPTSIIVDGGKVVTAFFGKKVGATYKSSNTDGAWFDASHWTPNGIPGTNDVAVLYSTSTKRKIRVPVFAAVGDLAVSNSYLLVAVTDADIGSTQAESAYKPATSYDTARKLPIGLDVFGDVLIDQAGCLYAGGKDQTANTKVNVSGDLSVKNGRLLLTAGVNITNVFDTAKATDGQYIAYTDLEELFRGGNRLSVGGDTKIGGSGIVQLFNDYRSGAAMWLDLADVEIAQGGVIDSYEGGYNRFVVNTKTYTMCPGGLRSGDNKSAGSHGGRGGNLSPGTYQSSNKVYGYENAPFYPGYANGAGGLRGGGSIRMDCDSLVLNGTVKANGSSRNKGGSAGGGIWINAAELEVGDNASIQAKGGSGVSGTGSGGGGGRIAICQGISDDQMVCLFTNAEHTCEGISVSSLTERYGERVSVAGGTGHANYQTGENGSAVFILATAGRNMLTVSGIPENIGIPTPGYGEDTYDVGTNIELSAPESVFVSADERSRRLCAGYVVTNINDEVLAESDEITGTFKITQDSFLTWDYTQLQHVIGITAVGCGHVVTNNMPCPDSEWQDDGEALSVTAVADEGYSFIGWTGELAAGQSLSATLSFDVDCPRTFKAVFVPESGSDRVWTGYGDGTTWIDPENWHPVGIPGPRDRVTITNGTPVANHCLTVEVASLYVGTNATLTVKPMGSFTTMTHLVSRALETDLWPCYLKVHGDARVDGTLNVGGRHSLSRADLVVGGNFTIGGVGKFNAYAGYVNGISYQSSQYWADGGAGVTVGGMMSLELGAVVNPWCEGLCGAPVVFKLGTLNVAEGAAINATAKGWFWTTIESVDYARWPNPQIGNVYVGGSYGGKSGNGVYHQAYSAPYGLATAPYMPGSSGGNGTQTGGGVIRITAETVRIRGTLVANGGAGGSSSGGGSGGGIWITCGHYFDAPSATISANGGNNDLGQAGGGGGRICIAKGLSANQIAEFYATGEASRHYEVIDLSESAAPNGVSATITVGGGISTSAGCNGYDGTKIWIQGPAQGTKLMLR